MTKTLDDLERDPTSIEKVRRWAEEVMDFMFTRSQENLTKTMPWGDNTQSGEGRKPTVITDTSAFLLSGEPPKWEGTTITFKYSAPHAMDVEFGSEPKLVKPEVLARWAVRKLGMQESVAFGFARALSKKIARDGIIAHPFLRGAISETIMRYNLKVKPPDF